MDGKQETPNHGARALRTRGLSLCNVLILREDTDMGFGTPSSNPLHNPEGVLDVDEDQIAAGGEGEGDHTHSVVVLPVVLLDVEDGLVVAGMLSLLYDLRKIRYPPFSYRTQPRRGSSHRSSPPTTSSHRTNPAHYW